MNGLRGDRNGFCRASLGGFGRLAGGCALGNLVVAAGARGTGD